MFGIVTEVHSGLVFFVVIYGLLAPRDSWLEQLTGIGVGVVFAGLSPQQIKPADQIEFSSNRGMQYAGFALILGFIFIPIHWWMEPKFYENNIQYAVFELFSFSLVGFMAGAIPGKEIRIDLKKLPNQGIWVTWNYSVMWFVCSGLVGGLFTMLEDGPEVIRSTGIALTVGLQSSLIGSNNSGLVCIQHLILRFTLWRKHRIPWNYARFLNYATERTLLQKVGGRYRFWHDFLREHFAEMNLESVKKISV